MKRRSLHHVARVAKGARTSVRFTSRTPEAIRNYRTRFNFRTLKRAEACAPKHDLVLIGLPVTTATRFCFPHAPP